MATYGIPTKALHEQWLGLVQPVGLVVAPAVLTKLELVPEQRTAWLSALQLMLTTLLNEVDGWNGEPLQVVPGLRPLLTELLDWRDDDLLDQEALVAGMPEVVLSEYGETLRPTHGVPKLEGEGLQTLVMDLTTLGEWGRDFDAPWNPSGHGWDATPQQRFERLLKETEDPIGLLFNFHDPAETSTELHELRRLHGEMDRAVLAAYGWSDVSTACGFGLAYLDTEEDAQLPDELQERIDNGELFFWDANDALDFQGQLQAYGAITGRRKLPWRYRWPDSVRDDVLARLLALNAERYAAEAVAMGLHSKGAKKTAGSQRGRKTESDPAINQSSFQLEPEPLQKNSELSVGR